MEPATLANLAGISAVLRELIPQPACESVVVAQSRVNIEWQSRLQLLFTAGWVPATNRSMLENCAEFPRKARGTRRPCGYRAICPWCYARSCRDQTLNAVSGLPLVDRPGPGRLSRGEQPVATVRGERWHVLETMAARAVKSPADGLSQMVAGPDDCWKRARGREQLRIKGVISVKAVLPISHGTGWKLERRQLLIVPTDFEPPPGVESEEVFWRYQKPDSYQWLGMFSRLHAYPTFIIKDEIPLVMEYLEARRTINESGRRIRAVSAAGTFKRGNN